MIVVILILIFVILNSSEVIRIGSYECGFERVGGIRLNFRVHFFIVLIIFALFDLEVIFLIGFLLGGSLIIFLLIIVIIYSTYYLEVYLGSLVWIVHSHILMRIYFL